MVASAGASTTGEWTWGIASTRESWLVAPCLDVTGSTMQRPKTLC